MKFEKCSPYVRYCDIIKSDYATSKSLLRKSYDNCMVYMLSGEAKARVADEEYSLARGDVLTWRAGMSYCIDFCGEKASYIMINFDYTDRKKGTFNFKIDPDLCEDFDDSQITDSTVFEDLSNFNFCVYSPHKNILEESFLALYSDFKVKMNCLNMRLKARISLILCELSNEVFYSSSTKTPNLVNEILIYVTENCTNPDLTNEDIARKFGFHPRHINRLVSQKTGYSLHRYVIVKRIQKAGELLIHSKSAVSDVATMTGFNNVYHFSRYFKQIMGLSPVKYRLRNSIEQSHRKNTAQAQKNQPPTL